MYPRDKTMMTNSSISFPKQTFRKRKCYPELFSTSLVLPLALVTPQALTTIVDVQNYFRSLFVAQWGLLAQVCRGVQLLLVIPATNETSEVF